MMVLLIKNLFLLMAAAAASAASESDSEEEHYSCDVFMAPSKLHGGGYGVFSARNFVQNEVVEMAPLFLPMEHRTPVLMNTALDDYHYGYTRRGETLSVVVFGKVMFYNHDKEPNVAWSTNIGRGEPSESDPDSVGSAVFVAKRNITKGEELFSSYGLEDGGAAWFAARRIQMADNIADSSIAPEDLDQYRRDYCSKAFAGVGADTYHNRIKGEKVHYNFQTEHLPSADAPTAVAKVSIQAGDRIEIAPALVLSRDLVKGTALAPLGIYWENLNEQQHASLKELRDAGQLKVQHQSQETEWHRLDHFTGFEDVVVFPAAGNIGMVERVGDEDPNCEISIASSGPDSEGAGLVLEVVALKDIQVGDSLRLNIARNGSDEEKLALIEILDTTGQPISPALQSVKAGNVGNEL